MTVINVLKIVYNVMMLPVAPNVKKISTYQKVLNVQLTAPSEKLQILIKKLVMNANQKDVISVYKKVNTVKFVNKDIFMLMVNV